jgi:hypothetical protein
LIHNFLPKIGHWWIAIMTVSSGHEPSGRVFNASPSFRMLVTSIGNFCAGCICTPWAKDIWVMEIEVWLGEYRMKAGHIGATPDVVGAMGGLRMKNQCPVRNVFGGCHG